MIFLKRLFNRLIRTIEYINIININRDSFIHKKTLITSADISGNVKIDEGVKIIGKVIIKGGALISIGRFTSLNGPGTDIRSMIHPVNIGSYTSIARGVAIQEFNHKIKTLSTYHMHHNILGGKRSEDVYSNGLIEIGNDVWIGAQCVILSGAKIGNGSIIAANSVVTGDIPPYAIAAGTPAKVLKYRFDAQTIEVLQQLKWWEWSIEKIKKNRMLFECDFDREILNKIGINEE